ncbi:MAG: FtsQ-type POTRA domain-containing protein [Elusimicrobiota bacterium]
MFPVSNKKIKKRPKHQAYRRQKQKLWVVKFFLTVSLAAAGWWGVNKVYSFLNFSSFFKVSDVLLTPTANCEEIEIFKVADIKIGNGIFDFSQKKVEEKLKKTFPAIERIKITRYLPNKVKLEIEERKALAKIKDGTASLGVDKEGNIFPLKTEGKNLPEIVLSKDPKAQLKLVDFLKTIQIKENKWYNGIIKLSWDETYQDLIFFLEDGTKIAWGKVETDESVTAKKFVYLETTLADLRQKQAKAKYVNLRYWNDGDGQIVVRLEKENKCLERK